MKTEFTVKELTTHFGFDSKKPGDIAKVNGYVQCLVSLNQAQAIGFAPKPARGRASAIYSINASFLEKGSLKGGSKPAKPAAAAKPIKAKQSTKTAPAATV